MTKIKLTIAYDGTDFHGFAKQRGLRTVQGTLEDTLGRILGLPVEVFGSGRTDAGVHARGQVVHFMQSKGPPAERYPYLLRRSLPLDIVPVAATEVSEDFHARFSVVKKTYRYTIQLAETPDIFRHRYSWHEPYPLDVDRMREVASELLGTHDFTSFCASATPVEDKRRTLYDLRIVEEGSYLHIYCTGNGFLQYMVRIIVGSLVDIGQGRLGRPLWEILQAQDRRLAGRTAPPRGLTMWEVEYP